MHDAIKTLELVLNILNSECKGDKECKIVSVDNGSIEFFIEVAPSLAFCLSEILDAVLKICGTIQLYKNAKATVKKFMVASKSKPELEEKLSGDLDKELEKIREDFASDLVQKTFSGDEGEKRKLEMLFKKFVKLLENGTNAEIKTPHLGKPEELADEDDPGERERKQAAIDRFRQKQMIDEKNRQLLLVQKEGLDLQLPAPESDPDDASENGDGQSG